VVTTFKNHDTGLEIEGTSSLGLLQNDRKILNKGIKRLVVVSNRLPVALYKNEAGEWQARPGSGGLVTALSPVLRSRGGVWVGWPGVSREIPLNGQLNSAAREVGCTFVPVMLSEDEKRHYYLGFSNETLWPLFHALQSYCKFDAATWEVYQRVNRRFAEATAESSAGSDFLWVHDYHLLLLAQELRRMGTSRQTGLFLHTPFPTADIFARLPWRSQILRAMLEYDLVGFQTMRDKNNFIHCAETLLKGVHLNDVSGRDIDIVILPEHETRVGVFPISIDFDEFSRGASEAGVTERVAQLHGANRDRQIILGVDRLDYSKGIPFRLRAFKDALKFFPDLRGRVTLIQVVVPSREDIADYQKLKAEIEGLVSEINGSFAEPGWIPVQYLFRSVPRAELLAYYRAARVALVTPLKDGMNLVAKEYCAANIDENGVLILSEFAGAAAQLRRNALLVNPYDTEAVARTIHRALCMGADERRQRMHRLRYLIRRRDIYWWAERFLSHAL
jgi:alpha,alpha-trehalose-phosphate synthase [UDP-forming]